MAKKASQKRRGGVLPRSISRSTTLAAAWEPCCQASRYCGPDGPAWSRSAWAWYW